MEWDIHPACHFDTNISARTITSAKLAPFAWAMSDNLLTLKPIVEAYLLPSLLWCQSNSRPVGAPLISEPLNVEALASSFDHFSCTQSEFLIADLTSSIS